MSAIGNTRTNVQATSNSWSVHVTDEAKISNRNNLIGSSRLVTNTNNPNLIETYKEATVNYVGGTRRQRNVRYGEYTADKENKKAVIGRKTAAVAAGVGVGVTITAASAGTGALVGGAIGVVGGPPGIAIGAAVGAGVLAIGSVPVAIGAGIMAGKATQRSLITHSSHYQEWKEKKVSQAIAEKFYHFILHDEILGNPNNGFLDPLSGEILHDPVKTPDGRTYERARIIEYMKAHKNSPLSGTPLVQVEELELPANTPPYGERKNKIAFSEDCICPDHRKRAQIIARIGDIIQQQKAILLQEDTTIDQPGPPGPAFSFNQSDFSSEDIKNIAEGLKALKKDLNQMHSKEKKRLLHQIENLFMNKQIDRNRYQELDSAITKTFQLSYDEFLEDPEAEE